MPFETFDSRMGKISVCSASYCEGCRRFEPIARKVLEVDENGRAIWNEDGPIENGISISCEYEFLCQNVARELTDRLRKDDMNDQT